ncbi:MULTISPECIES: hypothetical protein [unclassified Streptomyces]|uniref:hypothetical protein n=1 Tax=unclassified Streptomyces TaxID=2593676 RepID=UPI00136F5A04|nr:MULTISPECIES: hypothetical protein [unclassified Streptomyces]MYT73794.1 hypothetical protein [Streptomyces sp. SID8367]
MPEPSDCASLFRQALAAHSALMEGRGMTVAALQRLGPLAVFVLDTAGWRADALYALQRFLSKALDALAAKSQHDTPFRTAPATVAAALRAAAGIEHYPVSREWAGLRADPAVGESAVRHWEQTCGGALVDEIRRLCVDEIRHLPEEEACTAQGAAALPADSAYAYGPLGTWPELRLRRAALERARAALDPHMPGAPELGDELLWDFLRRTAAEHAEHYLDLTRHDISAAVQRDATATSHTLRKHQNTAALRAHSYLHYTLTPTWSPAGRLWLLSHHGVPHLERPSAYRAGGEHFRQAAAAALSRAVFASIDSPKFLQAAVLHSMARFLEDGTAVAAMVGPADMALPLRRYAPAVAAATQILLARHRNDQPRLRPQTLPARSHRVLHETDRVHADDLVELALLIRGRSSPEDKYPFIDSYLRKRAEIADRTLDSEELEALALADHYVEWDAVCISSAIPEAEAQLDELHRMIRAFRTEQHQGYATHRFRGRAMVANKQGGQQHTALHYAMTGVTRLADLRSYDRAGSQLEIAEAAHQHCLGLAGIWLKWLEDVLKSPRPTRMPAWVPARHACYWAHAALQRLESLDGAFPLPPPSEDVRWKEKRISTSRWRVQTRLIHARTQAAAHLALAAGLGSRKEFTHDLPHAGEPIDPGILELDSLSWHYHRILQLDEITERTDGPQIAQLALAIGFLDQGGLPTLRLEDMDDRKRRMVQQPLDFLFSSPDTVNTTTPRYGLPLIELRPDAAAAYLRRRNWDAGVLSALPPPHRDGTRAIDPTSPAAKLYRLLAQRNSPHYEPWLQAWFTA